MKEPQNIVMTGCEGFIGKSLTQALVEQGHRVFGIDRTCSSGIDKRQADLLDPEQTRRAFAALPPISAVVHTAALAHGQRPPAGYSRASFNVAITANVLNAVQGMNPRFLFLSSVAVYGEDRRFLPVGVEAELRPSTDYGKGKMACESLLWNSELSHCDILRLAPVYDAMHMKDVRKRVCAPGLGGIKFLLSPEPSYSLCHIDTLRRVVVRCLGEPPRGRRIANVADPLAHPQHEIASWFPGRSILFPRNLVQPFYYATYLLPPKVGYSLRCVYWKLMRSNLYQTSPEMQGE